MKLSDEALTKWEHIIDSVNTTEIPLECIKKIIFRLVGNKQKTINIQTLRKQGLHIDEIDDVINRARAELEEVTVDVDVVVDIASVAEIVQPETDKLLGKL